MSAVPPATTRVIVLHDQDRPPALEPHVVGPTEIHYADPTLLPELLPGADALFCWDLPATAAVRPNWSHAGALRWIHTASAGVDRLIFPESVASDVTITNSRGVFDAPMAEYVLGLVLAYAKDLRETFRLQDRRRWHHRETRSIRDAVAVVVGGGSIGVAIARLLAAVGMRSRLVGRTARTGVHAIEELPALLPDADYLVLAAPLTDRTRDLVDADLLRRLPPRARLINVGRGPLIVHEALVAALAAGRLAGAALDVFGTEPLPADDPLWGLPGVVVSPHMSGDALGWREAVVTLFADNVARYRAGQPLRNVVDKTYGYVRSTA